MVIVHLMYICVQVNIQMRPHLFRSRSGKKSINFILGAGHFLLAFLF